MPAHNTKVFLLCSGLGHINRGYESFTQECFDALAGEQGLDLTLFKGGGKSEGKQIALWNLQRESRTADLLGKLVSRTGYWAEQVTFTLSLLPHIAQQKPDVVYFSDANIGNLLWHWRRLTRQKFILLFSNGGPMKPPFPRWDYVQQLAPIHLEAALAAGQASDTQKLVPYGICMDETFRLITQTRRTELRAELSLPLNRSIVLSVGAINQSHKRMGYVIREVASLPEPRPYLIMLGQRDEESLKVERLGENLLGDGNFQIRTVPHAEVQNYYQVANMFVLASLAEGFGRVFLEALSYGLPCLAHDSALTRYIFGNYGLLGDLNQKGVLTNLIRQVIKGSSGLPPSERRYQWTFERFSWQCLRLQYMDMFEACGHHKFMRP